MEDRARHDLNGARTGLTGRRRGHRDRSDRHAAARGRLRGRTGLVFRQGNAGNRACSLAVHVRGGSRLKRAGPGPVAVTGPRQWLQGSLLQGLSVSCTLGLIWGSIWLHSPQEGALLSLIVVFASAITIRQRYRLTRLYHSLNLTLENISQGVMTIDTGRRMAVVNRRAAELLGLPV